jgi:hypothetical protein
VHVPPESAVLKGPPPECALLVLVPAPRRPLPEGAVPKSPLPEGTLLLLAPVPKDPPLEVPAVVGLSPKLKGPLGRETE